MAKGTRKLILPSDRQAWAAYNAKWYQPPPPDDHVAVMQVGSCSWAYEIKELLAHHNPEVVTSTKVVAEFPQGIMGDSYPITYSIRVKTVEGADLKEVLTRAIQHYPLKLQYRCHVLADKSLGFRPRLMK